MARSVDARFVTLAFCVLLDSLGGLQYIYGTFSVPIKEHFKLRQDAIDAGGFAQSVGANFGIHAGVLLDAFGPRPMILAGALLGFTSYFALFASIKFDWNLHDHEVGLYLIMFLQGQAQLMADMAVVPTVSRRFRENPGLALGFCKSFLGLSGSIVEQVYLAFFKPDSLAFMVFLSLYFPAICIAASVFVVADDGVLRAKWERDERCAATERVVGGALKLMPGLLALLLFALFAKYMFDESRAMRVTLAIIILCYSGSVCAFIANQKDAAPIELDAPASAPSEIGANATLGASQDGEGDEGSAMQVPLLPARRAETGPSETATAEELHAAGSTGEVDEDVHFTLLEAAKGVEFWLQAASVFVSWGAGLFLVINIGQLCEIVGLSKDDKDIFVSLISISNCLGRLAFGAISDKLMQRGIKRVFVFGGVTVGLGFAMLLLSLATEASLFASTILVGWLYGGCNVLNPAILGDLYGVRHIGSLYASMMFVIIGGTYSIATHLFASVYEAHSMVDAHGDESCHGAPCIELSARLCAGLCFAFGSIYLAGHWLRGRSRAGIAP